MSTAPHLLSRFSRAYAAARHVTADPAIRAAYFFLVALAALWPTLASANLANDFRDAYYNSLFEEVARIAVARFHELPLWDPYYCGGISSVGTPSAPFVSPTFVLTLLFGTLRGDALIALVMTVVGLEGTFRYARARGAGVLPAMMAAPVFALSGVFPHTGALGWTNFLGFELVPWALLGVRAALGGNRRGIVVAALAMAWMIGLGGTYTGPLTALGAAFEALTLLLPLVRRPGRLAHFTAMGIPVVLLALSLSLVRLWPVAETLAASPRFIGGSGGLAPKELWHALFGDSAGHFARANFLVGLPLAPLILLGIFRRRAIPIVLGSLVWFWLACGYSVDTSLFALLRTVPPYTMLRSPERFLVFVALAVACLSGLAIRRFEAWGRKNPGYLALATVFHAVLLGNTVLLVANAHAEARGRTMVTAPISLDRDFHQARGNRWLALYYPFISRGSLSCFDDYDVAESPDLRGDLEEEEYLADASAGTVHRTAWSPGRIDLDVSLSKPERLLVNQNWHPGWRSSVGTVTSTNGLLSVELPAGSYKVTLRFLPRSAVGGIAALLAGLLVAALVWRRADQAEWVMPGRDWALTTVLCGSPLVLAALSFAFIHEPGRPKPPLLTPSGDPMIVDEAPKDYTPIDARWDPGIVLQAAEVTVETSSDGSVTHATVELDWRIEQKLPPGLGVFIHFEKPGKTFGADHIQMSDVLSLEDAPQEKTIRDVFDPVVIPKSDKETTWKVYAGLWWARKDMTRIHVADPGKSTSAADRVYLGSFTLE